MRTLILNLIFRPLTGLLAPTTVFGLENLPEKGPVILAANHNSHLDTLVILCRLPTRIAARVRPLAARDHFIRSPLSACIYTHIFGIISIERHRPRADPAVLDDCREALRRGDVLLIYPEGTRGENETLGPLKSGIAHLVRDLPHVPIIPIHIEGTRRILPRHATLPVPGPCKLRFGPALNWNGSRRTLMSGLRSALNTPGSV